MADGYDFPTTPTSPQGYDFSTPAKKPGFWEKAWDWANKPLIDAPAEAGANLGNKMMDWGEKRGGFLGDLARYGGAYTESLGNVASQLTSPVNAALTAATLGSGTAEKLGAEGVASALRAPGYVAAGAQTAHGARDIYEGHPVIGGVETALGLLGLRGLFGGKSTPSGPVTDQEVVPTAQSGPGTAIGTGKTRARVVPPRPITGTGETPNPVQGPAAQDVKVPYREQTMYKSPTTGVTTGGTADAVAQAVKDAQDTETTYAKYWAEQEKLKEAARKQKLADAETARQQQAVDEALAGRQPGRTSVSSSAKGVDENGLPVRATTTWDLQDEEELGTPPKQPGVTPPVDSPPVSVKPEADGPDAGQTAHADAKDAETVQQVEQLPQQKPRYRYTPPTPPETSIYRPPMEDPDVKGAAQNLASMLGLNINNVPEESVPTPAQPAPVAPLEPSPAPTQPTGKVSLFDTHPEVQETADQLGTAYKAGDKNAGKQLGDLLRFMQPGAKLQENWKGAPLEGPVEGPSSPVQPQTPDVPAATTPEAQATLLDQLKKLLSDQESGPLGGSSGKANPALINLLTRASVGALGGGAIGATTGHPILGALGGALGTTFLGPGAANNLATAAEGIQAIKPKINPAIEGLNKIQGAGLFGPLSLAKKVLGDTANLGLAAASNPEYRAGILNAVRNGLPEAWSTAKNAFNEPVTEEESGLWGKAFQNGPLSWIGRGFNATTEGFKNLYDQAGMTPQEASHYTMTDLPENQTAANALRATYSSPLAQHISPGLRLQVNRFRGGLNEYMPWGAIQDPTPRGIVKGLVGPAAALAAYKATPDDFVRQHPTATQLIGASSGLLGIPVLGGMAAKSIAKDPSATVAKTIANEIPGAMLLMDVAQSPKEFLPNYLSRYTNSLKPLAELLDPQERQTTGQDSHFYDKTQANVPLLRNQLPPKDFKWSELTGGNLLSPSGYDFK